MYKVLITGNYLEHIEKEIEILSTAAKVVFNNTKNKQELIELVKDAYIIMTDVTTIDEELLDHAKNLKYIVEYGVGYDNIDVTAATKRGITVCNVPDAFLKEVSEHAITLIMAMSRKICNWHKLTKDDRKWDFNQYDVLKLYDKTLGLVGCGQIGRLVVDFANVMGMKVIIYDPYINEDVLKKNNIKAELVDLDFLCKNSDIISIHTPLTSQTKNMINKEKISLMKKDAILVNTSRGGIVNEKDMCEALEKGKFFGFATDVIENEPNIKNCPLTKYDNVLITPHVGWKSEVAAMSIEMKAVEETMRILKGEQPKNIVNK